MNQLGDAGERDRAADRAARAARTLAAVAHDAAREYVERDVVTTEADGLHRNVVTRDQAFFAAAWADTEAFRLDVAERERQARLRRWHRPAHSNEKGG